MNVDWLRNAIDRQRAGLSARLGQPLARGAAQCTDAWGDTAALNHVLAGTIGAIPPCNLLYAVDHRGMQVSANIGPQRMDMSMLGQDLSGRPYLTGTMPDSGFLLSEVYVSRVTSRPCVTAVQTITRMGQAIGYLAADFALRDLPLLDEGAHENAGARQIKGDPAIRETVFNQRRADSDIDRSMPEIVAIMDELLGERGVFHIKLHFSSSRATLWLTDDPYRYRVHVMKEIVDPAVCLAYPQRPYPRMAVVGRDRIPAVFDRFALLRNLDDTFYLRSGSLNIINGLVGLTFSCDGTYYLPTEEFLARDRGFWMGV